MEINNKIKAFTLIELLVVISIVTAMLTIGIPSYEKQILKNRFDNEAKIMIKLIMKAQEEYKIEHGIYYTVTNSSINNEQLISDTLKIDLSKSKNFAYQIVSNSSLDSYKIKAMLLPNFWMNDCSTEPTNANKKCKISYEHTSDNLFYDNWIIKYTRGTKTHYIETRYPIFLSDSTNGISYAHIYTGF